MEHAALPQIALEAVCQAVPARRVYQLSLLYILSVRSCGEAISPGEVSSSYFEHGSAIAGVVFSFLRRLCIVS